MGDMITTFSLWMPFLAVMTGFMLFNLILALICDPGSIIDQVARALEARARGSSLKTPAQQLEYAHLIMDALSRRVDHKTQVEMQEMFNLLASEIHRLDNTALPRASCRDACGEAS